MNKELFFSLKGERSYVHGTDIFNSFAGFLHGKQWSKLDIKFAGIVSNNLIVREGADHSDVKVDVRVTVNGTQKSYQLCESANPASGRSEYHEEKITGLCSLNIDEQQIQLREITPYSFCENLVAMHKCLLQSLFSEAHGKWYFTRLELAAPVADEALIRVVLVKNFNFRLVKSHIFEANRLLGSIYFTLVRG
ncbi:hypothetical protein [Ectopseudomonas mendocina]|uniref:hypothetical protein n=1 Tax=Ectopseudomonas mendocina TaxID=300 RepID=UPI003132FFC7